MALELKFKGDSGILLKYSKAFLIGLLTGLVNGLFGSGGGTIAVPAMVLLLGVEEHKAHSTAIFIILPLTLMSAVVYLQNSHVDWNIAWKVVLGGTLGGFLGAGLLRSCPTRVLRKVFAVIILIAAGRLLF